MSETILTEVIQATSRVLFAVISMYSVCGRLHVFSAASQSESSFLSLIGKRNKLTFACWSFEQLNVAQWGIIDLWIAKSSKISVKSLFARFDSESSDVTNLLPDNKPKTTRAPSEELFNYLNCIFSQTKCQIKKSFSGFLIDIEIYRISSFQRKKSMCHLTFKI